MTDFNNGDKVRVSFVAVVDTDGDVEIPNGGYLGVDEEGLTVELIEKAMPADNPALDLAGTVRRSPAGGIWVKRIGGAWLHVVSFDGFGTELDNDDLAGWPVVGTVPGTPAAERPRVFCQGDPEPPADVTRLSAPHKDHDLFRVGRGWWWADSRAQAESETSIGWNWPPLSDGFPLTEVVE